MRIRLSFVSALALLTGGAVWAQGFTPPTFDGIDKDKNGKLSKEEVAAWVKTIPAGPNGAVNADELFGRWDANKDGSVSKEEFENRPRPQGPGGGGGGGAPPPRN